MRKITFVFVVLFVVAFASIAYAKITADTIVDTGTPVGLNDRTISSISWWAGNFAVVDPYTITSIEGFMKATTPGFLTISLYSGDSVPVRANYTYRTTMTITDTKSFDWRSVDVSTLNWNLAAGDYWLAFEKRSSTGDTFVGLMQGLGGAVGTAPFESYAQWTTGTSYVANGSKMGARIYGNLAPEPISSALFLIGGAGLAAWQIRKKKRSA